MPVPRGALTKEEATRLFCARAADARGERVGGREELRTVSRIVELLGHHRVGIELAAARLADCTLSQLVDLLERLAEERSSNEEVRSKLADGAVRRSQGRLRDAAHTLESVLARTPETDVHAEAEAHRMLASVYRTQGRAAEALSHAERACTLFDALGDPSRQALSLGELGACQAASGRLGDARSSHERALAMHRALKERAQEGVQLSHLGVALHRLGLFPEARRAHGVALQIHRETGNRRQEGAELLHLAWVAHALGSFEESRKGYQAAMDVFREVNDRALLGVALSYSALLEVEAKRPEVAGPRLREAMKVHREVGSPRHEAITCLHLAAHEQALGGEAAARKALARALELGAGMEPEHRAWALASLGRIEEACALEIEDICTLRAILLLQALVAFRAGELSSRRARAVRGSEAGITMRVRSAMSLLDAALLEQGGHLEVSRDGRWFRAPQGKRVALERRRPLRMALLFLVDRRNQSPGVGASWREVLAAGWKGERVSDRSGFARVRNAMAQLRTLGLREALVTRDDGYLLDPAVPVKVIEI